uniref:fructose-2,6-bisphosphatase TIGAR-like n=1 Tax=Styela clava TaxID=7725 RepID=UPI00193A64E5|nr:fructose-2,6-bisphosphatase TIGAR-like [Styela clava]
MSLGKYGGFHVTFVRHGETDLNKNKIVQGQGVNAVLNEKGQAQARALGEYLTHEVYSHVYSSDLLRAKETCEIILSQNDLKSISECLIFDERIRERNYGEAEGFSKEAYEAMIKSGKEKPDGAESLSEVAARAVLFFNELCDMVYNLKAESIPNILVVSHGRLLATLITEFSEKFGCSFPPGKLGVVGGNTSRTCFKVQFHKDYGISNCQKPFSKRIQMHCTALNNSDHLSENQINSDNDIDAKN